MPEIKESKGLTIGEIALRCHRLARDPQRVAENIRHYAKLGYLDGFILRAGEGAGKHQTYSSDAAYIAAILVVLAWHSLHPGQVLWLSDMIEISREVLCDWKTARKEGKTEPLFVSRLYDPHLSEQNATIVRGAPPVSESAVQITVNLSLIWKIVEEAEEEVSK